MKFIKWTLRYHYKTCIYVWRIQLKVRYISKVEVKLLERVRKKRYGENLAKKAR